MAFEDTNDLHLRIARVTEDLRTIQQELNCAAMQAPSDPELMEALNSLSETEPIETLRVALDQMRHFLWFYSQVVGSEPELGDTTTGGRNFHGTKLPKPRARFWTNFRVLTNSSCCTTSLNPTAANQISRAVKIRSPVFLCVPCGESVFSHNPCPPTMVLRTLPSGESTAKSARAPGFSVP